jgi:hypothetical protein
VNLASDLRLGLRLTIGAGRQGLARLFLIASGIALAVGLLLAAIGIFPAEDAVEQRQAARQFDVLDRREPVPHDHLLIDYTESAFGDRAIVTTFVASVGAHPPTPPWLDRLPEPGEVVASPALAEILSSSEGALLRPRFPGRVIATLEDRWLLHPRELVAYVGAEPGELSRYREVAVRFGPDPEHHGGGLSTGSAIEQPLYQVAFLVSIGLMIPIVVFVVTGARLSASARESRLAAIRLVGGTPAQVRLVAAAESLVAGVLGCILGIGLFLGTRPVLAWLAPPGNRWFPSDIAPSAPLVMAVLLGVIGLTLVASLLSLRRVAVTPLGVVRGARRPIRAAWRWLMLAVGLGGLLIVMLAGRTVIGNNKIIIPVLVASYGLTGLGAAASAPLAGSAIVSFLARVLGGTGLMLGARRLKADPRTAGRMVAGVVIVVIAATVTSLYVGVYEAAAGDAYFPSSLQASTVIVEPLTPEPIQYQILGDVPGVRDVAPAWLGYTRHNYTVLVTDCRALDTAVYEHVPWCVEGDAYVNGRLYDGGQSLHSTMRFRLDLAPKLRVEVRATNVSRFDMVLGRSHDILVPVEAASPELPRRVAPSFIFVSTTGDPATVERIRNALYGPGGVRVYPRGLPEDYADDVPVLVGGAVTLGIAITFAIAAATLLITAVDGVRERRRSLATLAAVGTSTGMLRRALTVETVFPMLAGVALGAGSAIVGTWMVFKAVATYEEMEAPPPIYWRSLGTVLAFAIVATVVATIATFPSLGRAIRPESLRTE